MKIISLMLLILAVSFSVRRMTPVVAMDYLDALLKQTRRTRHSKRAVQFLEARKLQAEQRLLAIASSATANHFA